MKKQIKEAKEAKKRAKELAAAANSSEQSDEDDVLIPKQASEEETGQKRKLVEEDEAIEMPIKSKKAKVLKINMDGEAKAVKRAGAKKMTFDEEGNVVDPLARFHEHVELSGEELQQEMKKHAMRVKQQIDEGRHEDNLREKQRIREKHLKQKQQMKEPRQEQGPTLLNPVEEDAYRDQSDSDDDSISDSSRSYSSDESDDGDIRKQEELALKMLA